MSELNPKTTVVTAELIEEARGWISECVWRDLEPEDIAGLSATAIFRGVAKHYAGGWAQFVADGA